MRDEQLRVDTNGTGKGSIPWSTGILLVVVLLGTGLCLYQLTADSLWNDEIVTARYAQQPSLADMMDMMMDFPERPLYITIAYFVTFVGDNEFWLRLPSVVFGSLSLVITYKIGRILFGRREALVATLLLSLSPFHIRYCQEARPYALFLLLSLLTLYFLLQAWRSGHRRWWIGFTVTSILNTYTHYLSFIVLAVEVSIVGVLLALDFIALWKPDRQCTSAYRTRHKQFLAALFASLLIVAMVFLPSLSYMKAFLSAKWGLGTGWAKGFDLTVRFFAGVLDQLSGGIRRGGQVSISAWLLGFFFFLGLAAGWLRRQYRSILLSITWIALPFVILAFIPSNHPFYLHYFIFILPLYFIVVSRGLTGLGELLTRLTKPWFQVGQHHAYAFLGVAFLISGALSVAPLKDYYAWEKEDWRSVVGLLQAKAQPGSLIICDGTLYRRGGDDYRPFQSVRYYLDSTFKYYVVAQEGQVTIAVEPIAQEKRSVWGVIWGNLADWEPDSTQVSVTRFQSVSVIRVEGDQETVLEEAILLLETTLEFLEGQARFHVHLELGKLYAFQGMMDRASEHLDLALTVFPEDKGANAAFFQSYVYLGQIYAAQGDLPNAVLTYQRAIALYEQKPDGVPDRHASQAYGALGLLLRDQEVWPEAANAFQRAIELQPNNSWYRHLLAEIYRAQGHWEEAVTAYTSSLADEERPASWRGLALAYELLGLEEQAVEAWQHLLAMEPLPKLQREAEEHLAELGREEQ